VRKTADEMALDEERLERQPGAALQAAETT
jgi:hypothetical protein